MSRGGNWRREAPPRGRVDAAVRSWLVEPGSLTARCRRQSTSFGVRLLRAGSGPALIDEAKAVGAARCRVREVVLECDGIPVIFAHTVLPAAWRGRLARWLARLGNRSLGSLLFSHPGFVRGPIECRGLDARHPLYRRAAAVGEVEPRLWARRSLHRLGGQRVLVTEVFLPAIRRFSGS